MSTELVPAQQAAAHTGTVSGMGAREFLTFRVGTEEYGIDILRVQEIRSYEVPTRIANAPHHVKGVVNLRGVIVPIVDMRLKLNAEQCEYNTFTVVIVLQLAGGRKVGMVVDAVSDVLAITPDQIRTSPDLTSDINPESILGLGSVGDRMLILLNIEHLMRQPDMGLVD